MKRFIAVFGVIVIITMHCLSFYPAKATITGVDYGEMLNTYLGAAETALAASQGATIDWSGLEFPAGSDTWTDQEKAKYVVSYIGNLKNAGLKFWYDFFFGEDQNPSFDVISAETAAIGLSSSKNIDTLDIKAQLDNILATHSQDHVFQRYSDKVIARWNEYNTNYINDYLNIFDVEPDTPNPSPPITSVNNVDIFNLSNVTWSSNVGQEYYITVSSINYGPFYYPCVLGKTNANNGYVVGGNLKRNGANVSGNSSYFFSNPNDINMLYNNLAIITDAYTLSGNSLVLSDAAISYLTYGYIATPIDKPISVSIPNAVIDNSSDDGKIVAHPIYYPDAMNTDKAIDIDLDKVIDAIASRIAQGADDITFDDFVDAGAAVKLDGTTLTDADTVVKDVSVPIARAKVDTIDGVVPTIDVIPPLPPLPPLNPGEYSGEGFNGMSVLARIINATVQGLPEPLILTFFGVVFGAVILGIIKILHH